MNRLVASMQTVSCMYTAMCKSCYSWFLCVVYRNLYSFAIFLLLEHQTNKNHNGASCFGCYYVSCTLFTANKKLFLSNFTTLSRVFFNEMWRRRRLTGSTTRLPALHNYEILQQNVFPSGKLVLFQPNKMFVFPSAFVSCISNSRSYCLLTMPKQLRFYRLYQIRNTTTQENKNR